MLKTPIATCFKVFQVAVLLLSPVFCRTEAVKLTETGCSLIVENHLDEDIDFFIEGARLATIKPGEERQFIQLKEGELKAAAQGVAGKKNFWAAFVLARGKETRWKIAPEKTESPSVSQARGKIIVKNLSGEPVRIRIGGVDHEMLWENSEAVYTDFPPGEYTLEANGTKT
ncbi:MAG: hypothetical protein FJ088_13555, partial [Deltaproteobacteria bacterium]|nr:hypothetical protein [Deltaproteobacteria bacterium]